jgi:hypothetical protein
VSIFDVSGSIYIDDLKIINRTSDAQFCIFKLNQGCFLSIKNADFTQLDLNVIDLGYGSTSNLDISNFIFENIITKRSLFYSPYELRVGVNSVHETWNNCTFINIHSTCPDGRGNGAAISIEFYGTIKNCSFISCWTESEHGGAVYIYDTHTLDTAETFLQESIFINCKSAKYGGAISVPDIDEVYRLKLELCYFRDNWCSRKGGAIFFRMVESFNFEVKDSTFLNNSVGKSDSSFFFFFFFFL